MSTPYSEGAMTKKQLLVAVAICLALGAIYFVSKENSVRVGVKSLALPQFEKESISRIKFSGKEEFSLLKKGDDFVIVMPKENRELMADSQSVRQLIDVANELRGRILVSEQTSMHEQFKVDENNGLRVTLFRSEEPVWELIVGDNAQEGGRFVRKPLSDAVFLSKADFWNLTRGDKNDFREKRILRTAENDVRSLRVLKNNKQVIGFVRKDKEAWSFDKNSSKAFPKITLSSERTQEFVRDVVNMKVMGFIEDDQEISRVKKIMIKPSERLVISGATMDSNIVVLLAKDAKEDRVFASVEGTPELYEISKYAYERLVPKTSEFDASVVAKKKANEMDLKSLPVHIRKQLLEAMKKQG